MKISTDQLKSLMGARPSVVAVKSLCDYAGVNYDNIRMRLDKGQLRKHEEESLGQAMDMFLLEHLGWKVIGEHRVCKCGHIGLDHDMWGSGPCLECKCAGFTE